MITTGKVIKKARLKARLTQAQVAGIIGVCVSNITKYENNTLPLTVERFNVLKNIKDHAKGIVKSKRKLHNPLTQSNRR